MSLNIPRILINRFARTDTKGTTIYFVLNSQISMKGLSEGQVTEIGDEVDDFLMDNLLQNGTVLANIFGKKPLVKSISVDRLDWEIGNKMHRLHANLVVTIHHHVGKYSIEKINDRLRLWLNAQDTRSNGWHVHS